jgi:hypothetical protein
LLAPYLTDGRRLLRIVSHTTLGSEMLVLLEDCQTLVVELRMWQELAGRVRALRPASTLGRVPSDDLAGAVRKELEHADDQ